MLGVSAAFTVLALLLALADAKHLGKRSAPVQDKPKLEETTSQETIPHPDLNGKRTAQPPTANNTDRGSEPALRADGQVGRPSSQQPAPAPASRLDTFFERRALLPSLAMALVNIGFGAITTFIALHAAEQNVPEITWYFVIYAVTTIASRPIIGKIIDRTGYRGPSIFATLCTAATLALIGISSSLPMFCFAGAIGGLGIGGAMSTFQAMAVATVPPQRRGVATSTYFVFFDLGIAVGSFAAGIIANVYSYTIMYVIMAIFPILACIFFLMAGKQRLASTPPNADSD